jgi:hypothetical protein
VAKQACAGAKAPQSFCATYGPAKAVLLLQSRVRLSFSAACEVVPFQNRFKLTHYHRGMRRPYGAQQWILVSIPHAEARG